MLVGAGIEKDAKLAYYGSALRMILQCLTSGESSFPSWHDMFDQKKEKQPEETAEEIKSKIIRELRR